MTTVGYVFVAVGSLMLMLEAVDFFKAQRERERRRKAAEAQRDAAYERISKLERHAEYVAEETAALSCHRPVSTDSDEVQRIYARLYGASDRLKRAARGEP